MAALGGSPSFEVWSTQRRCQNNLSHQTHTGNTVSEYQRKICLLKILFNEKHFFPQTSIKRYRKNKQSGFTISYNAIILLLITYFETLFHNYIIYLHPYTSRSETCHF